MDAPRFAPATAGRWADLEAVMQSCSDGRGCWCAYWYLPNKDFKAGWGDPNRLFLKAHVESGAEPGLVAYVDDEPAGWVGVAPRMAFDRLNRSRNFAALDDLLVWSMTCFIVRKGFRRRGLMRTLIRAGANFAFSKGAPAIEAYPVVPGAKTGSSELYLGTRDAFADEGFVECARPLPNRPVMRLARPDPA